MSGFSIEVGLTDQEVKRALSELLDRLDRPITVYKSIGETLVNGTKDRFEAERGPDDVPWLSLKPATIKARLKRKVSDISILREHGYIAGSIHAEPSNDGVRIGAEAKHAAIHQFGGTIRKPEGKRWMQGRRFAKREEAPDGHQLTIRAHQIKIPSRPFIGVSRSDEARIGDDIEDWLSR